MARAWGSNAKVTTGLTAHSTLRTYSIWTFKQSYANFNRLFEKRVSGAQVDLIYLPDNSTTAYARAFGSGTNQWGMPGLPGSQWAHVAVVYDSSSAANDPVMYLDGTAQSIGKIESSTGAVVTNADAYIIGNRGNDNARTFVGRLCEFAVWDALLSADEVSALAKGFSASMIRRDALKCYVPLVGEGLQDQRGAVCTQSNTTVSDHPRIIYPVASQTFYSIPASAPTFQPAWAMNSNQVLYV